jgi:hypothetical protein
VTDPDLIHVVAMWSTMSDAAKERILDLVNTGWRVTYRSIFAERGKRVEIR